MIPSVLWSVKCPQNITRWWKHFWPLKYFWKSSCGSTNYVLNVNFVLLLHHCNKMYRCPDPFIFKENLCPLMFPSSPPSNTLLSSPTFVQSAIIKKLCMYICLFTDCVYIYWKATKQTPMHIWDFQTVFQMATVRSWTSNILQLQPALS